MKENIKLLNVLLIFLKNCISFRSICKYKKITNDQC